MFTVYIDMDGVLVDTHQRLKDRMATKGYTSKKFWSSLPPAPGNRYLVPVIRDWLGSVNQDFGESAFLLTKIPSAPGARRGVFEGKTAWVAEHRPELRDNFMLCVSKYQVAHPRAVLIDDDLRHKEGFEARGGTFIHWSLEPHRLSDWVSISTVSRAVEEKLCALSTRFGEVDR